MPMTQLRPGLVIFAVLTAVLTALLTVTPARAADGTITGLAGKCVDVAGASNANGTAVQLYDCNGTGAQVWSNSGDGTLRALAGFVFSRRSDIASYSPLRELFSFARRGFHPDELVADNLATRIST